MNAAHAGVSLRQDLAAFGPARQPAIGVWAAVPKLCGPTRPTAILGRVWPIILFTLQRQRGVGLGPHLRQEVIEDHPSFADGDAALAIMLVHWTAWVKATLLHGLPRMVFGRPRLAPPVPVPHISFRQTKVADCVRALARTVNGLLANPSLEWHAALRAHEIDHCPIRLHIGVARWHLQG